MKTTAPTRRKREIITTEHPHIVRVPGVRFGRPIIRGTGMPVWLIAFLYNAGDSVETILRNYPHLQASWIHDAISYYLDHRSEIDEELNEQRAGNTEERMIEQGFKRDERGFYFWKPQANSIGADAVKTERSLKEKPRSYSKRNA